MSLANNPERVSLANKSLTKKGKTKMEKSELMDKVLDACVVKYNLKSRSEAYPFVIGMATVVIEEDAFERMLDALN
jgi:hypothetical protein